MTTLSPAAAGACSPPLWPAVSIIVPVRNGGTNIERCIDALLAQQWPGERPELIVVDNASTDDTLARLRRREPEITVLEEPAPGVSRARNRAMALARGEWLAFTDADCLPRPDWLFELVRAALENPGVSFVGGRIAALRPTTSIGEFAEALFDQRRSIEEESPPAFISANLLARREDLVQIGGFHPAFRRGQDTELAWRSHFQHGARVAYAERAVIDHVNVETLLGLLHKGVQHGRGSARLWRHYQDRLGVSARKRIRQTKPYKDALRETSRFLLPFTRPANRIPGRERDPFYMAWFRLMRHLSFTWYTLRPESD